MEIKNTTIMKEKIFVSFQRISGRIFKKSNTANLIFEIFLACLTVFTVLSSAVIIVTEVFFGDGDSIGIFAAYMVFMLLLTALRIYQKLFLPKIMYKKSPLNGSAYIYTFKDEEFNVEAKSDKIETNEILKYTSLFKVYETESEMFLYISPYQAMLVSKYAFESESDTIAVREHLSALLGKKYIKVK